MERIAVIAGRGKFPLLFCREARANGFSVVALAVKGDTSRQIQKCAAQVYWIDISQFKKIFDILEKEGLKKLVMAGQVNPRHLFGKKIHQDSELKKILASLENQKADTIFSAIVRAIEERGVEVLDSSLFLGNYMPGKGILTCRQPAFNEWEDIYFGFKAAKMLGALDIGQSVAIKSKTVVAVEALEGTDRTIRRAGMIAGAGISLVKVSKPKQDMRFDIPVVGLRTLQNLARVRASCLALEAGKTLFIDKEKAVRLADRTGIAIVAV